ncbi:MAG: hypothetical protein ACE5MM_11090 [Nitrospiraceae bacterium]
MGQPSGCPHDEGAYVRISVVSETEEVIEPEREGRGGRCRALTFLVQNGAAPSSRPTGVRHQSPLHWAQGRGYALFPLLCNRTPHTLSNRCRRVEAVDAPTSAIKRIMR